MKASIIQARIDAITLQIAAYEAAMLAIATDGIESYTLDTGQTVQKVTKLDLPRLQKAYEGLLNLCTMLENRLNGTGVIVSKPGW